jgi:hypothetical protein
VTQVSLTQARLAVLQVSSGLQGWFSAPAGTQQFAVLHVQLDEEQANPPLQVESARHG